MADANVGRFVWYELMVPDPKAAMAFYTEIVGWKTQKYEEGQDYTMWLSAQGPLGGVTALTDEMKKNGAPPHWMAHVVVADVDATVATVKARGGRVHHGPLDIPKIGRFAVIGDPQGAALSVFKPIQPMAPHASGPGEAAWHELITSDQNAAFAFYAELFGWQKLREHDMGAMGTYLLYGLGDAMLGGMFTMPKEQVPPAWLYYFQVADVDGTAKRATAKGAKVLNGPMDVPGGDRIVQMMDPQGAVFALYQKKS